MGAPFQITDTGEYSDTKAFLNRIRYHDIFDALEDYGRLGVSALAAATPIDTGLTASDWGYRIFQDQFGPGIEWFNSNIVNGVQVVILIQYGHGTGSGGYVAGRDFINPTMQPIFDFIAEEVWKKVIA